MPSLTVLVPIIEPPFRKLTAPPDAALLPTLTVAASVTGPPNVTVDVELFRVVVVGAGMTVTTKAAEVDTA
jgi:hypothetical protein